MIEVADNFFFFERGWLNGNHFAWRGPRPVLIDTGYQTHLDDTLARLTEAGIDPAAVERIILTHTHCDHVGAVPHIHELSGCRVELHAISAHHIEHRNAWATWWQYYDQRADFFEVHRHLNDGDEVEIGPHRFQVIHAPGHAAGQMCLWQPGERILLSADALWDGGVGALTPRIEGMDCAFRALETVRRLAELKPRIIYPGHGPVIEDPEGAVARTVARLESFIADPELQGLDQVKKITTYTLLMAGEMPAVTLFNNLVETPWFRETVQLFFGPKRPRRLFDEVIEDLMAKGVIEAEGPVIRAGLNA